MDRRVEFKLQYLAAWCGVIFLVGSAVSFGLLGHNHPPPSRVLSPQQLVDQYFGPYHDQIVPGMVICMVFGVFYLPWAVAKSRMMLRKEYRQPLLSSICLLGGG